VRPSQTRESAVRAALDLGPCGLLLPCVESAAHLDVVRKAAWMPPRGQRRPGGPANRWLSEYTGDAFRATIEDHLVVIPQIETPQALERAAEIARHEITTALGIGPFDLSAQLGICGAPLSHPRMQQALQTLRSAAKLAGKPDWMIGAGPQLVELGFRFICIGEASALLTGALRELVSRLRP
jgi:2-keto-3-deoxy-L-rhamnonate aldolase RhmA